MNTLPPELRTLVVRFLNYSNYDSLNNAFPKYINITERDVTEKMENEYSGLNKLLEDTLSQRSHISYVIFANISRKILSKLPTDISYVHGISSMGCEIASEKITFICQRNNGNNNFSWTMNIFPDNNTDVMYNIIVETINCYEPWVSYETLLDACNKSLHYRATFWARLKIILLNPPLIQKCDIELELAQDNSHYLTLPFLLLTQRKMKK